jgi:predicted CXXCH cytochrome family protein
VVAGRLAPADLSPEELLLQRYTDDTHGRSLLVAGLVTAPTCVSCHGGHDVLAHDDPRSRVNPRNVSSDCGTCHVGILEQYRESVHGRRLAALAAGAAPEGREPATCTDCHQPHGIRRPDAQFKLDVIETCADCHPDFARTYRGTYHGRVTDLGFAGVASCDECHTAHRILPAEDPASSLHPDRRRATCGRCHEGATDAFAGYLVHPDPQDEERFPVLYWARSLMRSLIFGTWGIWGVHFLLQFPRAWKDRRKTRAAARGVSGRWYRRWPWS